MSIPDTSEEFLMRFVGGPHPVDCVVDEAQFPWPLPGILSDAGGHYQKVSESDLPPQQPGSHVMRSALYEWRSDNREGRPASA